jgi:3-deoxy-D-manno-octulosonic-acid transferase
MTLANMTLWQYQWAGRALRPLLLLWDAWRTWRQPIYRMHRSERWAHRLPAIPKDAPVLWVHAVSVGETQACAPLLLMLLDTYPKHAVLLTHMTPTGRDTGRTLFAKHIAAQRVVQCYLPYDIAGLAERFLAHFKPQLGVLMETEVWPHLIAACTQSGVPIGLANGRLSEKSLRKALRFADLAQTTYAQLSFLAAQSQADAQRFIQVCPRSVQVLGNVKFDVPANAEQLAAGQGFKHGLQRPTLALASTREGEEWLLLNALKPWLEAQTQPPLLVLVPRHPKRSAEIIQLLETLGLSYAQRSTGSLPKAETHVYLGDTLGEMWFYLGASDIVIMGGGWANLGGQNLIEPCMAGCAVVLGPHMFNFAAVTQAAIQHGAAIQCSDINDLLPALAQAQAQHAQGAGAGKTFASIHAGSTARHLALLARFIQSV